MICGKAVAVSRIYFSEPKLTLYETFCFIVGSTIDVEQLP